MMNAVLKFIAMFFMRLRVLMVVLALAVIQFSACDKEVLPPVINSVDPVAAPAETLITIEGENLATIRSINFSDQVVNFNTAFNADNALLMRVPTNVPVGMHEVVITTDGGEAKFDFTVTLDPPAIFEVNPLSAQPGDIIGIKGKNFFEPLTVYFHDSVQAEIIWAAEDSLQVQVPEGTEKGRIVVEANGGTAISPRDFFSQNTILVNDFDGNGLRAETNRWIFVGEVDQTPVTAVHSADPAPLDGNFLKLSGSDVLDISWIGGAQTHYGAPGDDFVTFGITTQPSNTFLEMDVHNNGREETHIILILLEHEGATADFTHTIKVDGEGWQRISIPLTRFIDINDQVIDPTKVRTLKIHLIDQENTNGLLEVNVDNISFLEVL